MKRCTGFYDGTYDQTKFDKDMLATADQDGLMSKEDKAKLDELVNGSTGDEEETETSVEAANVVQDETHRFVTDEQIAAWDAKPETKEDLELGNVTNDAQVTRAEMGVAGGVATLDDAGLIPTAQLPGFVDDIIEYDSVDAFPEEGESGKIYVDTDANVAYRWTGTQYIEIPTGGLALGETSATAYSGDKGKANADAITAIISGETVVAKATDASTVSGFAVGATVPANAKFTDTVYEHPETHDADIIVETTEKKFATEAQLAKVDAIPEDAVYTDTVYEHPETHEATMIVEDETHKFVTDEQIAKIDAIPEDPKYTDTVYEHPETHEAAMIVETEEKKFVSDEQIAEWDAKAEVTPVTAEANGLMIAEDKAKLDELYTIPTTPYYDEADSAVYGCGTGITIEAAEESGKIKITWNDSNGSQELIVPEGINIYGGGDGVDNAVNYASTEITMNSGMVKYIYGGNRRGNVGIATIVVNGGSFVENNGGITGGGHSSSTGTHESIVGHAEIIINDTDNEILLVYGGGQGMSVVGSSRVTINGGSINYCTAGGSNGHTSIGEVIVNGGTIKVLQGCNRGTMNNIKLTVNDGTIDKMFAGGLKIGTAVATATYAKSEVFVNGGTITSITAGTNGDAESADNVSGEYVEGVITDDVATAMNMTKAPIKFTDVVIEGTTLVFKHEDKVVKSIDLSAINA